MKLSCKVSVGVRVAGNNNKQKHVISTLAICKLPNKSNDFCIILFNAHNKNGRKYMLNNNIERIFTRCVDDGKVTIQFKEPPHDFFVQAEVIPLKSFLNILRKVLNEKVSEKGLTFCTMAVTPIPPKKLPVTQLVINTPSAYPVKGFPVTLKTLRINDLRKSSVERSILNLKLLTILDLSKNCIEKLPQEINKLPLSVLDISNNHMGKCVPSQWTWIGGNFLYTLKTLNLRSNELKYLPNQIVKLHSLVNLHVDHNDLKSLPPGIGNLKKLQSFTASNNSLTSLPGSARLWRLTNLELSYNKFEAEQPNNHGAALPTSLPMCALKELTARTVLLQKLPYGPGILPLTVIDYLDYAKYCICGKACFDVFITRLQQLHLQKLTHHLTVSQEGYMSVPMDCYFCSLKCFNILNYRRSRNPVI